MGTGTGMGSETGVEMGTEVGMGIGAMFDVTAAFLGSDGVF